MSIKQSGDHEERGEGGNNSTADRDMALLSVETLHSVFSSPTTTLYSNAAIATLLQGLIDRYTKRSSRRDRIALLLHWKKDHERLKAALETAASEDKVRVDDEGEFAHLDEDTAKTLMDRVCPADPYLPDPDPSPQKRRRVR